MPGSYLSRSWEISSVPDGTSSGGAGKGNRNPATDADEKSDIPIVPRKSPHNGCSPAEAMEGRGIAAGNAFDAPARRTQSRESASMGVEGIQVGAYRAQASRRVYLQKADGKERPLGIAAREDKVGQQAVATILSAIYETDFLGFSYGFRPGRGQHDALDAVWNGITGRKIGWIHANGEVIVVRYADDSIVGFQFEGEARAFMRALQDRLGQFGLRLHPQKTRLIEFGRFAETRRQRRGLGRPETFDFLGFTHGCSKTRQDYFKILRLTMKKRMRATLAAIRVELRRKRHEPVAEVGRWLKRVVQGYFNYHAVPDNLRRLQGFRAEGCRAWLQGLRRRSQRHRMTWVRFKRLIDRYVPRCRQQHPYPPQRIRVIT